MRKWTLPRMGDTSISDEARRADHRDGECACSVRNRKTMVELPSRVHSACKEGREKGEC